MARRSTHTEVTEAQDINVSDLRRDIAEINRQKQLGSEYNGAGGKLTRDVISRYHLDRKAFGFVMGLSRMAEDKRQATVRAAIELFEQAGFLDQLDAFSDVTDALQAVVDRLRARMPEKANDREQVFSSMVQ